MNFLILQTVVEATVVNYNTMHPLAPIHAGHVLIAKITPQSIDLVIKTPKAQTEVYVHAQLHMSDNQHMAHFTLSGRDIPPTTGHINDNDVTNIHKVLRKTTTIADLFTE